LHKISQEWVLKATFWALGTNTALIPTYHAILYANIILHMYMQDVTSQPTNGDHYTVSIRQGKVMCSSNNTCGVPVKLCDVSRGDDYTVNTSLSSVGPHLIDEVAVERSDDENDGGGNKYVYICSETLAPYYCDHVKLVPGIAKVQFMTSLIRPPHCDQIPNIVIFIA